MNNEKINSLSGNEWYLSKMTTYNGSNENPVGQTE